MPEDLPPDELTREKVDELLSAPSGDRVLGTDPETGEVDGQGRPLRAVRHRGDPRAEDAPRTASLFASMSLDTVTLDEALRLLTLPRVLGVVPDGEEIQRAERAVRAVHKKGNDSRSLETEDQLFTVTLDEALAMFAQPKRAAGGRAGRAAEGARRRSGHRQADGASGTAGSARTSPTARPTPGCVRATRSTRSPSSGRPSCSPTGAPAVRRKEEGRQEGPREEGAGEEGGGQEDHGRRRPPGRSGLAGARPVVRLRGGRLLGGPAGLPR